RVVTLGSPHHGSDLLRTLNARDETADGPLWVTIWTTDDQTVVPPTSGELDGALGFSVQSVCPGLTVTHADLPRTPAVVAMTLAALGTTEPAAPDGAGGGPASCAASERR